MYQYMLPLEVRSLSSGFELARRRLVNALRLPSPILGLREVLGIQVNIPHTLGC